MTTRVTTIRGAIVTRMQSVANIGVVNDYERYTQAMSELKTLYAATISGSPQLRGWHVRRVSAREVFVDSGRYSVHTRWALRGFMAIADANATEKTFDDLIEAACDAFRADDTLGGAVLSCIDPESGECGLQLAEHRPVLFAGVLCHNAILNLHTQHLLTE